MAKKTTKKKRAPDAQEKIVAAVAMFRRAHRSSEVVPRLSILLSGPSGCGKSEFVKYLGKCAGMEVVVVTASNILRSLVGETEQLDSAVMRRFTFKVRMGALGDDGKAKFFSRYFKSALTADEKKRLASIPNLTPGDFRTVRERLYFLGKKRGSGNARLLSALESEAAAKKGTRTPIGFAL